jgi:hypothetical protein
MYAAYVFSVVLGGGLLALSLLGDLLGGDSGDLGLDGHADLDVHLDGDFDAHVEAHLDGPVDAHADADHGGAATKVLSLRVLTYVLFGFGGVGWLLSHFGFDPAGTATVAYSAGSGLISGALVHRVFGYLHRTETGMHDEDLSFVGLPGHVTIPVDRNSAGSIVVERGNRRYTLRALPHASAGPDASPSQWRTVVVVEMVDGVARVAPADDDLAIGP